MQSSVGESSKERHTAAVPPHNAPLTQYEPSFLHHDQCCMGSSEAFIVSTFHTYLSSNLNISMGKTLVKSLILVPVWWNANDFVTSPQAPRCKKLLHYVHSSNHTATPMMQFQHRCVLLQKRNVCHVDELLQREPQPCISSCSWFSHCTTQHSIPASLSIPCAREESKGKL